MNIKKIYLSIYILSAIVFAPVLTSAQVNMSFCNAIDANNNPTGFYSSFTMPTTGAYIYVVLTQSGGETLNTHHILYDIYDEQGNFLSSVDLYIQPEWGTCWKQITFYHAGTYRIDAYDMDQYNDLFGEYGIWISTGYVTWTYQ